MGFYDKKGVVDSKNIDSYSGFLGNDRKKGTGLEKYLKQKQVRGIILPRLMLLS